MFANAALGRGWTVWNAEDERAVLAYRPDIFDGSSFPSPCLPTIYITRGRLTRRPEGNRNLPPDAPWIVTLRMEPDVERRPDAYEQKEDAIEGAIQLTRQFSAGELGYRSLYQQPRDGYLDRLDELTNQE